MEMTRLALGAHLTPNSAVNRTSRIRPREAGSERSNDRFPKARRSVRAGQLDDFANRLYCFSAILDEARRIACRQPRHKKIFHCFSKAYGKHCSQSRWIGQRIEKNCRGLWNRQSGNENQGKQAITFQPAVKPVASFRQQQNTESGQGPVLDP